MHASPTGRWAWLLAAAGAQALLCAPSEAASRVRPLTEEARLDPEDEPAESFYAANSALLTDRSGRLLCFWGAPRRDSSGELGIRAQAFSQTLAPLASEFLVNDEPHEPDSLAIVPPSTAITKDGTRVVAWSKQTLSSPDDYGDIFGKLLSDQDVPLDAAFRINRKRREFQFEPRVAGGADSRWIAGWQNQNFDPPDYSNRLLVFDGATVISDELSTRTEEHPVTQHIDVAANEAGAFYAVWSADTLGGQKILFGSVVHENQPLEPTVLANEPGVNFFPAMAAMPNGNLLVVWRRELPDGSAGLVTRVFDAAFAPIAPATDVWHDANPSERRDRRAALAVSPSGKHAVAVWEMGNRLQNEPDRDVVGQLLDEHGAPVGDRFPLAELSLGIDQIGPTVTYLSDDEFVVTWSSHPDTQYSYTWHVHARRFVIGSLGPLCGDANDDGFLFATDGLAALRSAVGLSPCVACLCDIDDSGSTTAVDALAILRSAVGLASSPNCPACAP